MDFTALKSAFPPLPSRETVVRQWSRFIYLGVASYGFSGMALGIINNNSFQLYTGIALFTSNVLGYYALTDLQHLEELVKELNQQMKALGEDVSTLTHLKQDLQDLLQTVKEEKEEYATILQFYKDNLSEFSELNQNIGSQLDHLPSIHTALEQYQALCKRTESLGKYLEQITTQFIQAQKEIKQSSQEMMNSHELLDRKTLMQKEAVKCCNQAKEKLQKVLQDVKKHAELYQDQRKKFDIQQKQCLRRYEKIQDKYHKQDEKCMEMMVEIKEGNKKLQESIQEVQKLVKNKKIFR